MLNIDDRLIREILPQIKPNAFAVLMAISIHLNNKSGKAFPSNATLQKITGMGRDAVESGLQSLKQNGLLSATYTKDAKGHFQKRILKITTKFIKIWVDADETPEFEESIENQTDIAPYPENPQTVHPLTDNQGHNSINKSNIAVSNETAAGVFSFAEFWEQYGYKKGRKGIAESKFKKLAASDREAIRDTLPLYLAETVTDDRGRTAGAPFKPMRKYPEFYISGRIWENYVELAAEQKQQNETLYPEWTDEYNQYLQWAETYYPGILKAVKQMSKAQFVRYRTEYYVPGKSFVGNKTERRLMTQAHRDMSNDPNMMQKYPDVFAYHCQLIEKEVKVRQI